MPAAYTGRMRTPVMAGSLGNNLSRPYPEAAEAAELQAELEIQRRMEGISTVAGSKINIRQLLGGFHPSSDISRDMKEIEMVAPMIRPYGCGPVAPQEWIVLRTYAKIAEMREGMRMDDQGVTLCDRDFKRCYQEATRQMEHAKGLLGRVDAIDTAFRGIMDKLWHRYLFPFGTFLYVAPPSSAGKTETAFKESMQSGKDSKYIINPYSVALADILYLCNTSGYLERFVYIIGIILWAKQNGANLLHHRRYNGKEVRRMSRLDQFYTLEKHLHVFGSIWLHLHVMQSNKQHIGGNWTEMMQSLETLGRKLMNEFNVNRELVNARVKDMTVRSIGGSLVCVQNFFRQANRVSDSK